MLDKNQSKLEKPQETIIYSEGLTKQFNSHTAVNKINLNIPHGSIFGFIGPSGCGKTTTVRLLTGLYQPTSGQATVLGEVPSRFSRATRAQIGYMPQQFVLYDDLSVWENLHFAASLYGVGFKRRSRLDELLAFVELLDDKHKLVRNLSGGMRRRLSLAATLIHNPTLLFLDEPTAGIDPVLRRKFWDHFKALQAANHSLFVTTQYVGEAAYCDYVGVMDQGNLLMVETPEGLRHRAFGGEVVNLRLTQHLPYALLTEFRACDFVTGSVTRSGDRNFQIVVQDASTAIPHILEWCQAKNTEVESIEEYLPPFDDVFVELIKEAKHYA
ncbi:MAG: ABC transporter ATP-binding protein [Anaerolineae bacterium]|nr:ABC transporter ATP-binding protein [Anaerolineae bacterium]